MRYLLLLALLAGCSRDKNGCSIPSDRQQSTSQNDRARRAQYGPSYTDAQYDSLAIANCFTVTR